MEDNNLNKLCKGERRLGLVLGFSIGLATALVLFIAIANYFL